jgi:hypothetical protein
LCRRGNDISVVVEARNHRTPSIIGAAHLFLLFYQVEIRS